MQDVSAMDKHIHQTHVYIDKAMEKQHNGMQKPVKDYCCVVDISCLHAGDSLKGAVIVIG